MDHTPDQQEVLMARDNTSRKSRGGRRAESRRHPEDGGRKVNASQ